jgi:hypothetical protein
MTWQETAKRLVAQPWWKDVAQEWLCAVCNVRMGHGAACDGTCFPDLTNWATVGILLGMCAEMDCGMWDLAAQYSPKPFSAGVFDGENWTSAYGETPGQAIAELLMELKGGDYE